jgi:hypothetical protein
MIMNKYFMILSALCISSCIAACNSAHIPNTKYMLPNGSVQSWPYRHSSDATNWLSKREVEHLVIQAAFGDPKSAARLGDFWLMVMGNEVQSIRWFQTAALLGDRPSEEAAIKIARSINSKEEVANLVLKYKQIADACYQASEAARQERSEARPPHTGVLLPLNFSPFARKGQATIIDSASPSR